MRWLVNLHNLRKQPVMVHYINPLELWVWCLPVYADLLEWLNFFRWMKKYP